MSDCKHGQPDWAACPECADEASQGEVQALKDLIASLQSDKERLEGELERYKTAVEEMSTDPQGDYYFGLGCGVEDRGITDRYDAAEYGWQQAFEYVASCAPTAAQPNMTTSTPRRYRWIPVSEPPEKDDDYLIFFNGAVISAKYWKDTGKWLCGDVRAVHGARPSHWMALPESPND